MRNWYHSIVALAFIALLAEVGWAQNTAGDKPSKMKVGTLSNNGGGGKKSKKKKKGGSGLPRATQDPGKPEFNPSSGGGGEEQDDGGINALMNKFRRSS